MNFATLLSGEAAENVTDFLAGTGDDPAFNFLFETIRYLTLGANIGGTMENILLAQTSDARTGFILIAKVTTAHLSKIIDLNKLNKKEPYRGHEIYASSDTGLQLTLLGDQRLIVSSVTGLQSAIDCFEGDKPCVDTGKLSPYLDMLREDLPLSFSYGLPALYGPVTAPGSGNVSLSQALAVGGAFFFDAEAVEGEVSFHTDNARDYVTRFNKLTEASELPRLAIGTSGTVDIIVPSSPLNKSPAELISSRNFFKKLIHGMNAVDYSGAVMHGGNAPWMNFDVGGNPYSIFINFEFKDQAQIEAFETTELPPGFKLAPIRILDTDEDSYFLVLNVYQSFGGLVSGARAEWSVFVRDPESGHPRFLVVQAAAASIAADSVNLLTEPEPVTHELVKGKITSYVGVISQDKKTENHYFTSEINWPQQSEVRAGFAREFVAANDYIFWGNGVADRGLYNASVHNRDAVIVAGKEINIRDDSRWNNYIRPTPKHSYVYLNPLDIVVSPWWNLDADYLDVSADYRQELIDFKNGFYPLLTRDVAESAVAGTGSALAAFTVGESVPTAYFNFTITDPSGLKAALKLPQGLHLAKLNILEEETDPNYYLTLRIYQVDGAASGRRAEWIVYLQGDTARPYSMVIDLLTEDVLAHPERFLHLPDVVEHLVDGDQLQTRLSSRTMQFESSIHMGPANRAVPTLDWVESGDRECRLIGICDKLFYDGQAMEESVALSGASAVTVLRLATPWDAFFEGQPVSVFIRDNIQQYASNPWSNVGR